MGRSTMKKLNRVMRDGVKCDFVFMFRLPQKQTLRQGIGGTWFVWELISMSMVGK